MGTLILLLIVAGCIAYQYFKGSLVKAAVTIITVLSAGIIALAFFEKTAAFLSDKLGEGFYASILPWLNSICFILLFVVAFALLQTAAIKLILKTIEFDLLVSRIGRCVCAAVYGWMLTGFILIALIMAPLPKNLPYSRVKSIEPLRTGKMIFSPDDAVCGIFSLLSRSSMAGKKSFSIIHPSLINQSYMNRLSKSSFINSGLAVFVQSSDVRKLSGSVKDIEGTDIAASNGRSLILVKAEIKLKVKDFTLSQVRLVCNNKENISAPLKGTGINIYPLGYMNSEGRLQVKRLDEIIEIRNNTPYFEFVFDVPDDYFPVWLGFKQNNIIRLPKISVPSDAQP